VTGERAQASVELAALAGLAAVTVLGLVQVLLAVWALERAERVAGTAAVLVAEGRAVPAELRDEADVTVARGEVEAAVRVPALVPGLPALRARARARLP